MRIDNDSKFMSEAIKEAKKAFTIDEVPIGAIIVKDNKIIARAHNLKEKKKDCTAHAEILAIQKASKVTNNWRLLGCTMYVTLEPCAMCASAISQARISRLVIALEDDKNGAIFNGPKLYKYKTINNFPDVTNNVCEAESKEIIKSFFKNRRK